MSLTAVSVP